MKGQSKLFSCFETGRIDEPASILDMGPIFLFRLKKQPLCLF
jgi:hypothetical protein